MYRVPAGTSSSYFYIRTLNYWFNNGSSYKRKIEEIIVSDNKIDLDVDDQITVYYITRKIYEIDDSSSSQAFVSATNHF